MDFDELINQQIGELSRTFAAALRKMMKDVVVQAPSLSPAQGETSVLTAPTMGDAGATPLLPLPTVDRTAEAAAQAQEKSQAAKVPDIPALKYFQAEPLRQLPRQDGQSHPLPTLLLLHPLPTCHRRYRRHRFIPTCRRQSPCVTYRHGLMS